MLADSVALPLLDEDLIDPRPYNAIERHVRNACLRVRDCKESCELAARLEERNGLRVLPGRRGLPTFPCPVDEIAKLLSEADVPVASSLGRNLKSDREEALVVALGVAADQRLDLVSGCHSTVCSFG